jgi:N-acetylmuramic acid 6-phosphate etherase
LTEDLDQLATERARVDLADIDLRPTAELVGLMIQEEVAVTAALEAAADEIRRVIDAVVERMARGGRLLYAGAGTAGRIAALDAAEVGPTFGIEPGRVVGIVAGGTSALVDAKEGLEDDEAAGAADVGALEVGPNDTVIGVTASGRTPYVLGAIRAGRARGALAVALVNNPGSALAGAADAAIVVATGPEFIAGSTRLKAGAAQKAVLNMVSTLVMVRLGRTYGNRMVNVLTHNEKLRRRALRIVAEAAGVPEEQASAALDAAAGETTTALVMLLAGVDAAEARSRLNANGGRVREAIAAHSPTR